MFWGVCFEPSRGHPCLEAPRSDMSTFVATRSRNSLANQTGVEIMIYLCLLSFQRFIYDFGVHILFSGFVVVVVVVRAVVGSPLSEAPRSRFDLCATWSLELPRFQGSGWCCCKKVSIDSDGPVVLCRIVCGNWACCCFAYRWSAHLAACRCAQPGYL